MFDFLFMFNSVKYKGILLYFILFKWLKLKCVSPTLYKQLNNR